jgi:hypothetical protein
MAFIQLIEIATDPPTKSKRWSPNGESRPPDAELPSEEPSRRTESDRTPTSRSSSFRRTKTRWPTQTCLRRQLSHDAWENCVMGQCCFAILMCEASRSCDAPRRLKKNGTTGEPKHC